MPLIFSRLTFLKSVEQIILTLKFVELWIDTYSCVCVRGGVTARCHTHTALHLSIATAFSSPEALPNFNFDSAAAPLTGLRTCHQCALSLVILWSKNRPLNVCENLDFKKDQLWLPAADARPSLPPCPPWLVSQILMPRFRMLGSEWPLLIKIWIYFFKCIFTFLHGEKCFSCRVQFQIGQNRCRFHSNLFEVSERP